MTNPCPTCGAVGEDYHKPGCTYEDEYQAYLEAERDTLCTCPWIHKEHLETCPLYKKPEAKP